MYHLPKFGKNIFSLVLRGFPHSLKGHDEAVCQGPRFGTLKPVSTLMHTVLLLLVFQALWLVLRFAQIRP